MSFKITGTISFTGIIADVLGEVLDWGLVTEDLTEGSEDWNLVSQAVTSTDDFGLITD